MTTTLTIPVEKIAERIRGHWTQGAFEAGDKVCLHGGVRSCVTEPGDKHIVSAVLNHRGLTTGWNDQIGRTEVEVVGAVLALPTEVLPDELAEMFGPQWAEIVSLVRRCAVLTADEGGRLVAAWDAARDAARDAAWVAARDAARVAAWDAARDAAWVAAWDAAWEIGRASCRERV